jgi:precorrin-2 dehydrogenase/sirohydrochlorin ferrochelatase
MRYYPVFLKLRGKKALVVGGGQVAERKVETLLACGASVAIVSKDLTTRLQALVRDKRVGWPAKEFTEIHLEGVFLVIAATDDAALNHRVSNAARARGQLINAVDQPEDCDFIVPSIVRRGDLTVAISTSGKSPALAKEIRKELEIRFGIEYEALLNMMGRLREEILSRGLSQEENSRMFREIIQSDILKALGRADSQAVESILRRILPEDMRLENFFTKADGNRGL